MVRVSWETWSWKTLCECYFVNKEYLRPFSQTLQSDTGAGGVTLYFYCIFSVTLYFYCIFIAFVFRLSCVNILLFVYLY